MRTKSLMIVSLILVFSMLLSSCSILSSNTPTPGPAPLVPSIPGTAPVKVSGEFTYTNGFAVETYYVEQAVALTDMHGFVIRDMQWELPIAGQTLGYLKIDTSRKTGTYFIDLPAQPEGTLNDVANDNKGSTGVQIFAVGYSPNLAGGPYSEGDDPSFGWPGYLASIKTDSENKEEVTGGKLLIWAPDANQKFPTAFGSDKLLFTADDPEGSIPAGWSVVNLDTDPFTVIRESNPTVELYEPSDVATKDYSSDTYTQAFQQMFDFLKQNYAFNDVPGKAPKWDEVYAAVYPKVQDAEAKKDATAYYLALREFTWAFHDGHVGLDGGDVQTQVFSQAVQGGYGLAVRETDDGKVVVTYITSGGPADKAGILQGAEITEWNGQPILEALRAVKPLSLPVSTDFSLHYQQDRYLTRATAGTEASLKFTNPTSTSQDATLIAVNESQSFSFASIYKNYDPNVLPVEFEIKQEATGDIGYVKINSNYDDLNLIIRLFNRALKTFSQNNVAGIVIDLRVNSGGADLGLAGFLYDKEISMGQLEYFSTKTGKFEADGPRGRILPNVEQYTFKKMALLVDQACASACELEAYGFSQVPGMQVFGTYPTAGVEAEVARGQFLLPEGFSMQAPTGRFLALDGSIFLEGKGVQPTVKIPLSEANLLSPQDVVLDTAVEYVLKPLGAGVTPNGNPVMASISDSDAAIRAGTKFLEDLAPETKNYVNPTEPGKSYTYTVSLGSSDKIMWGVFWCAVDKVTVDQNFTNIEEKFTLNGQDIPLDQFASLEGQGNGMYCRVYGMLLSNWPAGEHHLQTMQTFKTAINDGTTEFAAGTMEYDYTVFIAP